MKIKGGEKEKMDSFLMNPLFESIRVATTAGMMEWKPTGEVVVFANRNHRGHTTQYKNFILTIIVCRRKRSDIDFGLRIETEGKTTTLSSNPKLIPGRKESWDDLMVLANHIQQKTESRNLDDLLHQELTREFLQYSK